MVMSLIAQIDVNLITIQSYKHVHLKKFKSMNAFSVIFVKPQYVMSPYVNTINQDRRQEFPEGGYRDSQSELRTSRNEVLLRRGSGGFGAKSCNLAISRHFN
jgi:hypothetical protein